MTTEPRSKASLPGAKNTSEHAWPRIVLKEGEDYQLREYAGPFFYQFVDRAGVEHTGLLATEVEADKE